jgi:hypothetical protein
MTVKQYFFISVAVFIATVVGVSYLGYPVAPFAIILLFAETLVAFQMEDHKVRKFLSAIFKAPKHSDQNTNFKPN